ncbi:MAG TPA: chemotaxis protein CheW [Polyangiaceae bacterium]|jgi:chemotaxis signal transduction protein|nr:chemotaxis protein CheW [Polyangiaceae bacterium]
MRPKVDWENLKRRTALSSEPEQSSHDLERVFAERALALAQTPEEGDDSRGAALLSFVHAELKLAVDTTQVLRILRPRALTRIPCAPEHIDRVLYEAGRIVTVADLSLLFGRGRSSDDETRIVLLEAGSRWLGIRVHEVIGPVRIDLAGLTLASPSLDPRIASCVRGISDDMTIVLEAALLVKAMQSG